MPPHILGSRESSDEYQLLDLPPCLLFVKEVDCRRWAVEELVAPF